MESKLQVKGPAGFRRPFHFGGMSGYFTANFAVSARPSAWVVTRTM